MYNFIRFGVPVLILVIAIVIPLLIPLCQPIQSIYQIIIAALVGGIPMWLISNLLHKPNVVIDGLENEVTWNLWVNGLKCSIPGRIRNKSSTGEGTIEELLLTIFRDDQGHLDVPVMKSIVPSVAGFRVKPYGIYPAKELEFELLGSAAKSIEGIDIAGKLAEIRLIVIGQKMKTYKVIMKEKMKE